MRARTGCTPVLDVHHAPSHGESRRIPCHSPRAA